MGLSQFRLVLAGVTISTGLILLAGAGPLDPPVGPVAPTPGPEPRTPLSTANTPGDAASNFKITAPGSYYLTGPITGATGKNGILIAASDVTLDLNGFRLVGIAGSLSGIAVSGTQSDIAIRNGILRGWGSGGIALSTCTGAVVEDLRCVSNTGHGMQLGADALVRRCYCTSNTQAGITTQAATIVSDSFSRLNGQSGIATGDHSTVTNCVSANNTGGGLVVGAGAVVKGCVSAQNGVGVSASSGLNASDTIVRDNNSHGFTCFGASYSNCLATANTGDGFNTDSAMIANCRSTSNQGNGFLVGSNSMVVHSLAVSNSLFGVHANSGFVLANHCAQNSGGQSELREIKFDTRGRAEGNHLSTFNAQLWGLGGPSGALFIRNSINGGFVTTFGGTEGPDISSSNIANDQDNGNFDLP